MWVIICVSITLPKSGHLKKSSGFIINGSAIIAHKILEPKRITLDSTYLLTCLCSPSKLWAYYEQALCFIHFHNPSNVSDTESLHSGVVSWRTIESTPSFYRCGIWGPERLYDLPRITWLLSRRAGHGTEDMVWWCFSSASFTEPITSHNWVFLMCGWRLWSYGKRQNVSGERSVSQHSSPLLRYITDSWNYL